MKEKAVNKLTLKAGNNILKLMGKANQAKTRAKQELLKIYQEPTYSLPKLPPNTNSPSIIMTYCQILLNNNLSLDSIAQNPLNTNNNKQRVSNNFKIRHSSLSFIHKSSLDLEPTNNFNQDSTFKTKKKVSKQINALQNKYSFLEIAQTSDINYFIIKKFEPEIALFMNGANKIISVISQQENGSKTRTRINLSHISNYIMKTNKSLEIEKQRTYDVKFVGCDCPSFELSEKVDFSDSPVSIITPNAPPFSYLFVLNLVEDDEILNFAKIIHQIRKMSKEDTIDENKQNSIFSSIIVNYPIYRQICQICKKNCTFSVVLFLRIFSKEKEAEKLVNLFCEKKKSFLIDGNVKNKSPLTKDLVENIQPQASNSDDTSQSNENDSSTSSDDKNNNNNDDTYFADDSGGNEEDQNDFETNESISIEKNSINDQDEASVMIDRAESEIKETREYIIKNTDNIFNEDDDRLQEKNEEVYEAKSYSNETKNDESEEDNSSLFELLKKLNNSEKENKEKLEKISEIHNQLKIMEENIATIKSRQLEVQKESENVDREIIEIQKQTENQANENEKMKGNVKEMIIRTSQLKSKYNDLLNEIHEKERKQREEQWKIISEKEKEMKIKVSQSESKWRKELESRKNATFCINDKENQSENDFQDQKNKYNQPTKF